MLSPQASRYAGIQVHCQKTEPKSHPGRGCPQCMPSYYQSGRTYGPSTAGELVVRPVSR
ncbi:hypothetical protein PDIG_27870 [Penicillium digitatum PHI26]|uniref:Uncharacterized protein n=2 Tax=Penicillium digitatum TaxID=36651 RepID=K9GPM3_PEND2|nr:hypothetical protein PDIP_62310 [Penicillium digitatum Pd1]EKV09899.1 hypothetical protein PDIP_62310 [Penicillium digitatum Pd1]EKV15106.1 hypothetical protein PDIG_27870 [Penicillium digitatum PHI26]